MFAKGGISLGTGLFIVTLSGCCIGICPDDRDMGPPDPQIDMSMMPPDQGMDMDPAAPLLQDVAPAAAAQGATVTLRGARFQMDATVRFGGVAATEVTWRSATELSAKVPPQPGAFGKEPVEVRNPDGRTATLADRFSYVLSQFSFGRVDYPVGQGPLGAALGDLNGDGRPDVVVANFDSNNLSVGLNQGGGVLSFGVPIAVANSPSHVALADVDRNGRLDILAAMPAADDTRVAVLRGNGNGTFAAPANVTGTGKGPFQLALGDLGQRSILDLVTANFRDDTVSVCQGNGMGSFNCGTTLRPVTQSASSGENVALVDLDGDGRLDVAFFSATPSGNFVDIFPGKEGGAFDTPREIRTCDSGSSGMTFADLDGDRALDLIVACTGSVSVHKNLGGFGFKSPASVTVDRARAIVVRAADLDGDGALDLLMSATDPAPYRLVVAFGDGNGSFRPGGGPLPALPGSLVNDVLVGQLDGDGRPDIIATNQKDNTVSIYLNTSQ